MPRNGSVTMASWNASLTSSADAGRASTQVRSVSDPTGTGTRTATLRSRPARSGMTSPRSWPAPVDDGTMFWVAARARRGSWWGESTRLWSFVNACTVVIQPDTMPNRLCSTDAMVATQFVVQDALDTTQCRSRSSAFSLTPMQIVTSAALLGADTTTWSAP